MGPCKAETALTTVRAKALNTRSTAIDRLSGRHRSAAIFLNIVPSRVPTNPDHRAPNGTACDTLVWAYNRTRV